MTKGRSDLTPAQVISVLEKEYSRYGKFIPGERPPYPPLRSALDLKSSRLRLAAVMELGLNKDKASLLTLKSAVWDWYMPVRVAAVKALESMGETGARDLFVSLASSGEFNARYEALRLLNQLRDRRLLPVFENAAKSDDPRISTLAAMAIFSLGENSGLETLKLKLKGGTPAERLEAAGLLATLEDPDAEEAVRDLLRSSDVTPALKEAISSSVIRAKRRRR